MPSRLVAACALAARFDTSVRVTGNAEQIDQLSEDMIAPCFYMNIGEAVFNQMEEQKSGAHRKAYMANVLVTQLQEDGKR
uniref:Uncharacterized protein n=1 Tax=mine drainage metagenome TaxID=410659 RepID=E6PJA0_9ZZZZ